MCSVLMFRSVLQLSVWTRSSPTTTWTQTMRHLSWSLRRRWRLVCFSSRRWSIDWRRAVASRWAPEYVIRVHTWKNKKPVLDMSWKEWVLCLTSGLFCVQSVSLPEAKLLLKEDDELIKEVFDYWSRKRKNSKCNSLIPSVKTEKRDGSSTNDPYVAFRRRTEKMQTRKVSAQVYFISDLSIKSHFAQKKSINNHNICLFNRDNAH